MQLLSTGQTYPVHRLKGLSPQRNRQLAIDWIICNNVACGFCAVIAEALYTMRVWRTDIRLHDSQMYPAEAIIYAYT